MADLRLKAGDRHPPFSATLKAGGAAVDLTGSTVLLIIRNQTTAEVDTFAMSIVSATAGTVTYEWGAGETDTAGTYDAEIEVTFGDGTKQTFPTKEYLTVEIEAALN